MVSDGYAFLVEMLRSERDPNARKAMEDRLRETLLVRDLAELNDAEKRFEARTGRPARSLEERVESGTVNKIREHPLGGAYYLDPESSRVKSTVQPVTRMGM